jgi:phage tail-like protein
MASTGTRTDPLLAFRFEVTIHGLPTAEFSECSGLQAEMEVQEYREGGLNTYVHRFPTRVRHPVLTFRRGIVDRAIWDWYDGILKGNFIRRIGSIAVLDAAGADMVVQWEFSGAFPSNWRGPDLNAGQSSVAVETFELTHQGLTRIGS